MVDEVGADAVSDGESVVVKAKIIAVGVLDILIDLLVPTLVYLALAPTHRSAAVRLTVGGFAVAAKSVTGRVREGAAEVEAPGTTAADELGTTPAERPSEAAELGTTTAARSAATAELGTTAAAESGGGARLLTGVIVALVASAGTLIAAYAGAGDTLAILIGTLLLAAAVTPVLLRRTRIDGFALLVLGEVATSVVLVLISDDPRFILARPAFYTAIAGIYAIATCWTSQPFMMEITRPVAAGGNPVRAAAFDRAWTTSPSFRRAELAMTFGLGLVLLGEAALRVIIVYTQPRDAVVHASLLSQLPSVVLLVGYLVAIRVFVVPIASREVDKEMLTVPNFPATHPEINPHQPSG